MPVGTEARLRKLSIVLPAPPEAGGNYVPAKTLGRMVYLAGVISNGPEGVIAGTVGLNRSIEEGYLAAKSCALTLRTLAGTGISRHVSGSRPATPCIWSVTTPAALRFTLP